MCIRDRLKTCIMKTKIHFTLYLFSLLIFNYSYSQTLIPDPIFEQYLIDEGYDTAPIDGSVPTANIVNVTIVDLNNTSVSNLTGIEAFTALTRLEVYNTLLSNLNVSQNTALTYLEVSQTSLSSLDVSMNTALTHLSAARISLSSLDVSTNTALTFLSVYMTSLSSLDVSTNIALTRLDAYITSIPSLDISTNTALTNLDVFNTPLNNLDVSANTALTNLNVSYTSLSSLDVSTNTALTSLHAHNISIPSLDVSTNTALIDFSVNNTSINSLDISTNTALIYLQTQNTSLNNLDVSANIELTYLRVNNTSINSLDVSTNTVLTTFYATDTPNLDCITVADEVVAMASTGIYANWEKDLDCIYSEDCDALSVLEFETSKVYVGPNPIKDELDIVLNNLTVLNNVSLFDITGKLILTSTSTNISTSHIETGLYLVKITTDKGSFTKKLVKK